MPAFDFAIGGMSYSDREKYGLLGREDGAGGGTGEWERRGGALKVHKPPNGTFCFLPQTSVSSQEPNTFSSHFWYVDTNLERVQEYGRGDVFATLILEFVKKGIGSLKS